MKCVCLQVRGTVLSKGLEMGETPFFGKHSAPEETDEMDRDLWPEKCSDSYPKRDGNPLKDLLSP